MEDDFMKEIRKFNESLEREAAFNKFLFYFKRSDSAARGRLINYLIETDVKLDDEKESLNKSLDW